MSTELIEEIERLLARGPRCARFMGSSCEIREPATWCENCKSSRLLRAARAELLRLRAEGDRYENAQCITCARDLDAALTPTEDR